MPPLLPGQRPPRMSLTEITMAEKMDQAVAEMMAANPKAAEYDIMTHDNRGESYRDTKQGSLLVKRTPHQVRPFADTGVDYSLTEDGILELSLNNVEEKAEYEWNSFHLSTKHELCQACCDVFNYYCRYKLEHLEVSLHSLTLHEPSKTQL